MKVLLSTYSCFPCQTSEPGNAWRAINEALKEHEVWAVIADAHRYRELTEPVLAKNPLPMAISTAAWFCIKPTHFQSASDITKRKMNAVKSH